MNDENSAPEIEWPREIWMAELDEYHNGQARAVLSVHATIPRYQGDTERDCDFHKYVDADIHESAEKYWQHRADAALEAVKREAFNEGIEALINEISGWTDQKHISEDIKHDDFPNRTTQAYAIERIARALLKEDTDND